MNTWFKENYLKANPDKFQFILFDKTGHEHHPITIQGTTMETQDCVKLGTWCSNRQTFNC